MIRSSVGRAVRGAVAGRLLHVPRIASRIAGTLSGIGFAYDAPHGSHPSAGKRIGDLVLANGSRLYELLREGRFILLSSAPYTDLSKHVLLADPVDQLPLTLVRPDGHIAWATETQDPVRRAAELTTALTHWLP